MKAGALARIIVPDLEIYVNKYNVFRKTGEKSMPYGENDSREDGLYTPSISLNRIFHGGHRFIYDFPTMAAMLEKVGFVEITKVSFGVGASEALIFDTPERQIESLYVEARKPVA